MKMFYNGKMKLEITNGYKGDSKYYSTLNSYYWFRSISEVFHKHYCLCRVFYWNKQLKDELYNIKPTKENAFLDAHKYLSKDAIIFLDKNFDSFGYYGVNYGSDEDPSYSWLFRATKNGKNYCSDVVERLFHWNLEPTSQENIGFSFEKNEYCGFTHRGGGSFGKGDKLFIEDPIIEKIDKADALKCYKQYAKYILKQVRNKKVSMNSMTPISFLPFKRHGTKTIETMDDAFQAAKNMAEYLD